MQSCSMVGPVDAGDMLHPAEINFAYGLQGVSSQNIRDAYLQTQFLQVCWSFCCHYHLQVPPAAFCGLVVRFLCGTFAFQFSPADYCPEVSSVRSGPMCYWNVPSAADSQVTTRTKKQSESQKLIYRSWGAKHLTTRALAFKRSQKHNSVDTCWARSSVKCCEDWLVFRKLLSFL